MPLDNKISNILGVRIPEWLYQQLQTRSAQNSKTYRDNNNLVYLANKTAWIRLVSSVNITDQRDRDYFRNLGVDSTSTESGMASEFTLFGGTSLYSNKNYTRFGLGKGGSYGILGESEIQKYGYRPMPGITSVNIETKGRLGSVREATVNFKCWDKDQLDIIDALYFKLGYSMFLEWGHTYYYPSQGDIANPSKYDPTKVRSTEFYTINPFEDNLTKEEILRRISQNSRDSEGNYDAMLGIVTNFNFSFNQDGAYDCTLRITALGALGDSIKINNPTNLPNVLKENIKIYNSVLEEIARAKAAKEEAERRAREEEERLKTEGLEKPVTFDEIVKKYIVFGRDGQPEFGAALGFTDSNVSTAGVDRNKADIFFNAKSLKTRSPYNDVFGLRKLKAIIPLEESYFPNITAKLDVTNFNTILSENKYDLVEEKNYEKNVPLFSETVKAFFKSLIKGQTSIAVNSITAVDQINAKSTIEYEKISYKRNRRSIENNIEITRNIYALTNNPSVSDKYYLISNKEFVESLNNFLLEDNNVRIKNIESELEDQQNWRGYKKIVFTFQFDLVFNKPVILEEKYIINLETKVKETSSNEDFLLTVTIKTDDTSLIKSLNLNGISQPVDFISYEKQLEDQNQGTKEEDQASPQDANLEQTKSPLESLSSLELILRTIQVHSLSEAIRESGLDIGRKVEEIPFGNNSDFVNQIFSSGVFTPFINQLISGNISDKDYDNINNTNSDYRFKVQAKYGFATNLMGNKERLYEKDGTCNFPEVDYKKLLTSYVVPYDISQEIESGTPINHPVYISFGTLLMILNHSSTIYAMNSDGSMQKPLIYIDFNPDNNFCLSHPSQLSTDPFTCLIPFEGVNEDYQKLFDETILENNKTVISALSGSTETTPLFTPTSNIEEKRDNLSGAIPPFKGDAGYRGKIMNVLLNIDYLMNTIKSFSTKNDENKVFLKPFLEQIIIDISKSTGNFNIFRLSYNDPGNTYQITDDQITPTPDKEIALELTANNNPTLPLFGKTSIAKSVDIKTEISNRLTNMLAISANANTDKKATLSTNGDIVGYINTNYVDRYIQNRQEIEEEKNKPTPSDGLKNTAIQFNSAIQSFYNSIAPSQQSIGLATNYFISKITTIKGNDKATRASAMIPVSINFTTDGVSGFNMGQAFTVPNELIPYTYSTRRFNEEKDYLNKVGFVVIALSHTIEGNSWNTAVKANMIFLKDRSMYEIENNKIYKRQEAGPLSAPAGDLTDDEYLDVNIGYPQIDNSQYPNIKFGSGYLGTPASDRINPNLLRDINNAAKQSEVIVTITTAVSGHNVKTKTGSTSRHVFGNAVDIAIVNGVAVKNKSAIESKVESFILKLQSLGYARRKKGDKGESGEAKVILAYGYPDHDNHIHISNTISV